MKKRFEYLWTKIEDSIKIETVLHLPEASSPKSRKIIGKGEQIKAVKGEQKR